MNISELLQSTQYLRGLDGTPNAWGPKNTFTTKKFGTIYLYNKQVRTKTGNSVIEISMMIKTETDKVEANYHRVMMAIYGVNQRTVQGLTLAKELEAMDDKYKEMSYEDLIAYAIEGKPFPDKTVIRNEAGTYTIIDDNVSKENRIMVHCSCSDYFWTWQYYNVENDVDITKTAVKYANYSGKSYRNPNRHPGMCKHLLLLLALLMDPDGKGNSGVIKEARNVTRQFRLNIEKFTKAERLTTSQYKKIMKEWEEGKEKANITRKVDSDPVLQRKKKSNWRAVQRKMVG